MSALFASEDWTHVVAPPSVVAELPNDARTVYELYARLAITMAGRCAGLGLSAETLEPVVDLCVGLRIVLGVGLSGMSPVELGERLVVRAGAVAAELEAWAPDPAAQRVLRRVHERAVASDAVVLAAARQWPRRQGTTDLSRLVVLRAGVDALLLVYLAALHAVAPPEQRAQVERELLATSAASSSLTSDSFDELAPPYVGSAPAVPTLREALAAVPARTFELAASTAFDVGDGELCRAALAHARELHPQDAALRRFEALVSPPTRVATSSPVDGAALEASRRWIDAHGAEYRGQWVVVRAGELLGAADRLADVRALVAGDDLVARIPG